MKKLIVTLSLTAALLALPAAALAEKFVFVTTTWEPYIIFEKGEASGVDVDIIRELCKRLGFEPEIQILPWKRALMNVKEGKADAIFTPRYTEERAEFMYYPSEPLHIEKTVIVARKGSGMKITELDDLKDKVVGVVRGYAYDPEFDKYEGFKRKDLSKDDKQLVKKFANSRIPLIASSDEGVSKYLCRHAGVEVETVYVLNETPSYIGFSRTLGEKGKTLAEKFSQALRKLKEEGAVQKIESKYF
jgi:polar amino acid transport system substrate-binding protein